MYLRGSKWSMTRSRRRRSRPWRIGLLVVVILGLLYFNQFVITTMPAPFTATATPTRSVESFLNEAQVLYSEGKLTQAISAYKKAIISDPENPSIFLEMSRLNIYASEYEDALTNAEDALLLNPNNAIAHAMKALALIYLEQPIEAETSITQALDLDPNNAFALAVQVQILLNDCNFEEIERSIGISNKAIELAPNSIESHRARGLVLMCTGNYSEAAQEYKQALAINDKLWELHYSLGSAYRFSGEFDLAQQSMLAAIALNPQNPDIPTDLSRTYATQGQFGKAVQYAEQAVKIASDNPRLHGNLGFMYYKNAQYDKAVEELTLAVTGGTTTDGIAVEGLPLEPGRIADEYYSFYGLALARQDRCAEAVPVFQFILQNIAEDQVAFYNANEGIDFCQEGLEE
jgi:tetratricopeptide (TPR) repeat protein